MTPTIAVTNIAVGFSREISSFTELSTWPRFAGSLRARHLHSVLVSAMNNEAGTPLPETSPIMKNNRRSSSMKAS